MQDLNTIRIDLNSKDGREVVENFIRGTPGALIGRAKNGSAALVFRSTRPHDLVPSAPGANRYQQVFELATNDGAIRITISTDSAAPLDGYKWDREIPHHELSVMPYTAADIGTRVIEAAFKLGLTWASIVDDNLAREERARKLHEDIKAGRVKLRTPEEIAEDDLARRDAELVKNAEGREYEWTDGPHAQVILQARGRHKLRQSKQTTAA